MESKARDRRLEGGTTLRQCQLVQLYLLEILDEICKEHGLRYFLDFGTLLGAMRHNGAIPWDDDLDVSMPDEDYRKFCAIAVKVLPKGVLLQTPKTNGGFYSPIARLRDCCSFYVEPKTRAEDPSGVFVDIYPIRKDVAHFRGLHTALHHLISAAWGTVCIYRTEPSYSIFGMWLKLCKGLCWQIVFYFGMFCDSLLRLFGVSGWSHPFPSTSRPFCVPDDWIFPLCTHSYEGGEFLIPNQPEKMLQCYFGDWRKLPPEDERNPDKKMKLILPDRAPKVWWAVT